MQSTDVCDRIELNSDDTMYGHKIGIGSSTDVSLNDGEAGRARGSNRALDGRGTLTQLSPIRDQSCPLTVGYKEFA